MLNINGTEFLTGDEAAAEMDYAIQTFHNRRTRLGDRFIKGYPLLRGRVFFKRTDVLALALTRAA